MRFVRSVLMTYITVGTEIVRCVGLSLEKAMFMILSCHESWNVRDQQVRLILLFMLYIFKRITSKI